MANSDNQILKAGVMGWPVKHSLSPRLHGFWLRQHKINGSYVSLPVEPDQLNLALKNLPSEKFRGVNLTIPHKEAALAIVDKMDDLAKRVGAINTVIVKDDGRLEGRNTDVFGFTENIRAGNVTVSDRPVVLLGAGGAARAALVALLDMGFSTIRILNRTVERAENLANEFSPQKIKAFGWDQADILKDARLLINATSLGLKGHPPLELDLASLPKDAFITDMVYAPLVTDLLRRGQERGNKTIDGLGMLLHQARPAFKAFFGVDPAVTAELRQFVLEGL